MQLLTCFRTTCGLFVHFSVFLAIAVPSIVGAQPVEIPHHKEPFALYSGVHDNPQPTAIVGYRETVRSADAVWLQLHFSEYNLGKQSYVTITSLQDEARQRLDAKSLEQWRNSTAIFNGDAVDVELQIAPGEEGIFINIQEITVGERVAPLTSAESLAQEESLCASDNRVPSTDRRVGRIVPIGCTGWIVSNGAYLTAGHCTGANMQILEFNVPASLQDGTIVASAPQNQYPIDPASVVFFNDGAGQIGNDWAVFDTFPNTGTGGLAVHTQGAFFRMSRDDNPTTIRVTGYGVDSTAPGTPIGQPNPVPGTRNASNQTEQTDSGAFVKEDVQSAADVVIEYTVDTTGGNSGSPVINITNGLALGIHTNAGCDPANNQGNTGTGFEHNNLENAIQTFPGANVVYADNGHPVTLEDGTVFRPFDTVTEAVQVVPAGGIISIVAGSYNEVLTIDKAVTLTAPVGTVTIGTN